MSGEKTNPNQDGQNNNESRTLGPPSFARQSAAIDSLAKYLNLPVDQWSDSGARAANHGWPTDRDPRDRIEGTGEPFMGIQDVYDENGELVDREYTRVGNGIGVEPANGGSSDYDWFSPPMTAVGFTPGLNPNIDVDYDPDQQGEEDS